MSTGTKIGPVEFAPIHVPMRRRIQTAVVLFWVVLMTSVPMSFCLFFALLLSPFCFIAVPYLAWIYYDRNTVVNGGRPNEYLRSLRIWENYRDYFPVKLVKTAEIPDNKNYVFAGFPHGVVAQGGIVTFGFPYTGFNDLYPNIKPRVFTLKIFFWAPLIREFLLMMGFLCVSKECIRNFLTREKNAGHAACIAVGGAEEALFARPNNYQVKLRTRSGFVREAIMAGAHLVPVYAFGENDLYRQIENEEGSLLRSIQETVKLLFGFTLPIVQGRGVFQYSFGLLPQRVPLNTIIGAPIAIPHDPEPSKELVKEWHEKFCNALSDLFEAHKLKYGVPEDAHLEML